MPSAITRPGDLYLAEADPISRAGIVIDNDDLAHPVLL